MASAPGSATATRIAILQPALNVLSETFIRAHAERLPADVTVLHGVSSGLVRLGDKPVLSQTAFRRAARALEGLLTLRPRNWHTTAALRAVFLRIHPHAVLAEYGTTGVHALKACRWAGVPLVVHFHGFDASKKSILRKHQAGYRRLFQEAAALVAVSRAMQQKLISLGARPEKVHYCPYGVEFRRFSGGRPSANPPVFLAVGRFVEKKSPDSTLRAFAETFRAHPESRLRMIGDGPLLAPCRDLAAALGVGAAVTFLGAQPHEAVAREMCMARAFVQHSVEASDGDCEGLPVVILEAGAAGLPVIATRHAGIPDVIVDGETGLLVHERDVAGMAVLMGKMVDDPQLAAQLGQAARARIEQHFSMQESIDRLWTIIETAVRGTQSPA
jgi:glycosyltransferase involved in cell wall biosynthesis